MTPNSKTEHANLSQRRWGGIARFLLSSLFALHIASVEASGEKADALVAQPFVVGFGERLATDVYIDGKGPFQLLLDTASSRTIIYEHVRAQLNLEPVGNEHVVVFGLNGVMNAPAVRPDELRLSNVRIRGLTVAALPDPGDRTDEADGILGLDILERYFVVLDQREHRLQFFARASGAPEPYSAWPRVPLRPRRVKNFPFDLWYVDAQISKYQFGTTSADTLFDLGAGVTIINWETAYRFRLRKWGLSGPSPQQVQDGLGKRSPVALLTGLWIAIGDQNWLDENALIADPPVFDLLELSGQPCAIVGPGLLKNESLAIDFQNHYLYIAPKHEGDRAH